MDALEWKEAIYLHRYVNQSIFVFVTGLVVSRWAGMLQPGSIEWCLHSCLLSRLLSVLCVDRKHRGHMI
eukprot:440360-Amorphochlora_amoeboformis.AAC.1